MQKERGTAAAGAEGELKHFIDLASHEQGSPVEEARPAHVASDEAVAQVGTHLSLMPYWSFVAVHPSRALHASEMF